MKERGRILLLRIWDVIGAVSVRTKIMGIVLGLVFLLGVGVTLQVRTVLTRTLSEELEQRGISIARNLAARSTDLILTNDLFGLHELLRDTVENNADLRYAFLLDTEGHVLVHSFTRGVPPDLLTVNPVRPGQRFSLEILDTEEGLIRDVAVPIFEGRAGTARVGLSEHRLQAQVTAVTRRLLLTTLFVSLVGIMGGYLLAWVLTRPVRALVEVTRAVARGDLTCKAPRWANDELGALGASFNTMIDDLAQAQREQKAYEAQLLRRNRELSALNAVAQAVSGSRELKEVLEHALAAVLEVTGLRAGWICLLDDGGKCAGMIISAGLSSQVAQREATACLRGCRAKQVLHHHGPLVVAPLSADCPIVEADLGNGQHPCCHVAVPLVVRDRILGVLNIASASPSSFGTEALSLLAAIGQQLGVAVENARLWQELKQREALRGQLLDKIITAQEEERKRIARELHDETSQALTSMLVRLRVLEEANSLREARQVARELKAVAAQTLDTVHDLALELRPSVLDDLGLVAALQRYVRGYRSTFGLDMDFQTVGLDGKRLAPQVETALYRIVQEALTNVARHAQARHVSVLLEERGRELVAIIEDDGRGFDVQEVLEAGQAERSLGLHGMRERAELLGGTLTVEATPGVGTTVFVHIPLEEQGQ